MRDDDHGIVDDPRPGRQQEDQGDASRIPEEDERRGEEPDDRRRDDELEKEIERSEGSITDPSSEAAREIIAEALLIKGWSGLLPDPDSFDRYRPDVQDHMLAWNDAKILDESKRLDKLVDANIAQTRRDGTMSFIVNLSFAAIAFLSFIITKDPASFGFLAVPGLTIAINSVDILRRGSDRPERGERE